MRKSYYIFLFGLTAFATVAQSIKNESKHHHCFFRPHSLVGGLSVPYSWEFNAVGINTRLYYNISEQFCFGPEFSFIKANQEELKEVNVVAHYIFETKLIGIYPLAGVNYSHEMKIEPDSDWGIVFGAGVHRNVKKFNLFAEVSFTESDLRDRFIKFGFLYMF